MKSKTLRVLTLALVIVTLLCCFVPATYAAETATIEPAVAQSSVRLRRHANASSDVIATIPNAAEVTVLEKGSTWWKVRYDGNEGYATASSFKLGSAYESSASGTATAGAAAASKDVNAKKIADAQKKNKDVIGWVNVPNTNVDEPILYGANFYYADHNINKKKAYTSVYAYSSSKTPNIAIFGHNIRKSAKVLHGLLHLHEVALGYKKCQNSLCRRSLKSSLKNWYKTKAGRTWNISIFGMQKWEVFAMYEVPRNEPSSTLRNNWNLSPADIDVWIAKQVARSQIDFDVSVSADDQILTLITCGTNYDSADANSRLFVFLKNVD